MEKSSIIASLLERLDALEDWRKAGKEKNKKPKVDEEVCPECGGDLLFIEEGIVYCSVCKEYYENEDEKK